MLVRCLHSQLPVVRDSRVPEDGRAGAMSIWSAPSGRRPCRTVRGIHGGGAVPCPWLIRLGLCRHRDDISSHTHTRLGVRHDSIIIMITTSTKPSPASNPPARHPFNSLGMTFVVSVLLMSSGQLPCPLPNPPVTPTHDYIDTLRELWSNSERYICSSFETSSHPPPF